MRRQKNVGQKNKKLLCSRLASLIFLPDIFLPAFASSAPNHLLWPHREVILSRKDSLQRARGLFLKERHGVLCTLSQALDGWPFASLTPYAFAATGDPIILTSTLAEHTRNIDADPRVSLFIVDSEAVHNPQAGARLTLMGLADAIDGEAIEDARQRYLGRFPESESLFQMTDFTLFKLSIERARFIGGFGDIFWINSGELIPGENSVDEA